MAGFADVPKPSLRSALSLTMRRFVRSFSGLARRTGRCGAVKAISYNAAMSDVTQILNAIEQGDLNSADQLLPMVYEELRKLAAAKLAGERPGQTLQSTALVHEAYLRLVGSDGGHRQWEDRGHFFAAAAEAMRRILVEQARRKKSLKAGGQFNRITLAEIDAFPKESTLDLVALDEAIVKLEGAHPRKAELVKLRYFGGLTIDQAARAIGVSTSTADADWAYAKGWLKLELQKN